MYAVLEAMSFPRTDDCVVKIGLGDTTEAVGASGVVDVDPDENSGIAGGDGLSDVPKADKKRKEKKEKPSESMGKDIGKKGMRRRVSRLGRIRGR